MLKLQKIYPNDINIYTGKETIRLYHGSKSGIKGSIRHDFDTARARCDFGRGFYMGTNPKQAKTLVSSEANPTFYELELHLNGLNCIDIKGIPWALVIAFNREFIKKKEYPSLYNFIQHDCDIINNKFDIISGIIADDKMATMLRNFFANTITDIGLIECLKCINYGYQFVSKSETTDKAIKIIKTSKIHGQEQKFLRDTAQNNTIRCDKLVTDIQIKTFRNGQIFGEIVKQIENSLKENNDECEGTNPEFYM